MRLAVKVDVGSELAELMGLMNLYGDKRKDCLKAFIQAMLDKMEKTRPKYGDWRLYSLDSTRGHLQKEVKEWEIAVDWEKRCSGSMKPSPERELEELVDTANLCFMIWDLRREAQGVSSLTTSNTPGEVRA